MDYSDNSRDNVDVQMRELPVRITNSFPPRGIVANILTSNTNKDSTFHLLNTSIQTSQRHMPCRRVKTRDRSNASDGFSPPPTMSEIRSLTRKTPRFYTVNSSYLRNDNSENLPGLDKLIVNSELTGLKEIYQKVCKGNVESLKSLLTKGQICQRIAFLQTSSPLRYNPKGKQSDIVCAAINDISSTNDNENQETVDKRVKSQNSSVLVPSPYFRNEKKQLLCTRNSDLSRPPYVYAKSRSEMRQCWSAIAPTIINLNHKLPELPKNKQLHTRYSTKNIRGVNRRLGEGTLAVVVQKEPTLTENVHPEGILGVENKQIHPNKATIDDFKSTETT